MTKLFVAINFSSKGLLSRKITGFRKRFDPKFNNYSFAHMAMMAPFECDENQKEDLVETLKEELDTFYYGNQQEPKLGFTGLGVYQHKRKQILYLNPHYEADLEYCSEIVMDICKSFIPAGHRYKENKSQFLPLGYFNSSSELQIVMEHAKLEFTNYSELPIESISLYEKKFGVWVEKETLVNFEQNDQRFLQLNNPSI